MRNRWIKTGLLVAAGLLTGPAADRAQAQPTAWDVSGNEHPPVWAPIGTYQHDGSGWYTGIEFVIMNQPRAIGHQRVAIRGFVDSAGFLTGTPGTFLGTGEEALNTNQFGRTGWSPGRRVTFGYRFENGWNFSISWLHVYDTKYAAAPALCATTSTRSRPSKTIPTASSAAWPAGKPSPTSLRYVGRRSGSPS